MTDPVKSAGPVNRTSRFQLAPPRRFLLPALLLLLSEEPAHGYSLLKELENLNFGRVDRPSVYRALAELETDGLVESWEDTSNAGHARHVYEITNQGQQILRTWMGIVKEERDLLVQVLNRYQATGTADALIAEAGGGWATLRPGLSPMSSTAPPVHYIAGAGSSGRTPLEHSSTSGSPAPSPAVPSSERFHLVPDRSVILIDVRSSVGALSFGAIGVTGWIDATTSNGAVHVGTTPSAHLEIAVDGLRSGNGLYDAELLRRIDARKFPTASIDLRECMALSPSNRYHLSGDLTFHGITQPTEGTVTVDAGGDNGRLVVDGDQAFDIRDFDHDSPTVLMLRIYPDVRVRLHVEAEQDSEA